MKAGDRLHTQAGGQWAANGRSAVRDHYFRSVRMIFSLDV